jgi:hypothetical protein
MSKQTDLFAMLMQSLSHHLRPAPYPYGLLTLRLLGKLGGKNREFLREPLTICTPKDSGHASSYLLQCSWGGSSDGSGEAESKLVIPLPIDRCVEILKNISSVRVPPDGKADAVTSDEYEPEKVVISWDDCSKLWTEKTERIDHDSYCREVMVKTCESQAKACMTLLKAALGMGSEVDDEGGRSKKSELYVGLLYASTIDCIREEAKSILRDTGTTLQNAVAVREAVVLFLGETSGDISSAGVDYVQFLGKSDSEQSDVTSALMGELLSDLCGACASSKWGQRSGLIQSICVIVEQKGPAWSREHELELISAAMMAVKSTPRELSSACVECVKFFYRVCTGLYGNPWPTQDSSETAPLVWDMLVVGQKQQGGGGGSDRVDSPRGDGIACPSEEVRRIVLIELASQQQIVR